MSNGLGGATGLIGTAFGLAALGLALGFVSESVRTASGEARRRPRRGEIGFGFNSGNGKRRRRSGSMGIDDIFAPPRRSGKRRSQGVFF